MTVDDQTWPEKAGSLDSWRKQLDSFTKKGGIIDQIEHSCHGGKHNGIFLVMSFICRVLVPFLTNFNQGYSMRRESQQANLLSDIQVQRNEINRAYNDIQQQTGLPAGQTQLPKKSPEWGNLSQECQNKVKQDVVSIQQATAKITRLFAIGSGEKCQPPEKADEMKKYGDPNQQDAGHFLFKSGPGSFKEGYINQMHVLWNGDGSMTVNTQAQKLWESWNKVPSGSVPSADKSAHPDPSTGATTTPFTDALNGMASATTGLNAQVMAEEKFLNAQSEKWASMEKDMLSTSIKTSKASIQQTAGT